MQASDSPGDPRAASFSRVLLLLGAHAALLGIAFGVPYAGPAALCAVIPALIAAYRAESVRHLVAAGLITQVPLWLFLCGWMLGVSLPGGLFFAPVMAMLILLPYLCLRPFLRGGWSGARSALLCAPLLLIAAEYFRADIFLGGYPWFLGAHALASYPVLVQTADLFGAGWVSMLATLPGVCAFDLWRWRRGELRAAHLRWSIAVTLGLCATALLYGVVRVVQTPDGRVPGPVLVLIQTDMIEMKAGRNLEQQLADFERFTELTLKAMLSAEESGVRPDAYVWPETMLPGIGFEAGPIQALAEFDIMSPARFAGFAQALQDILGVPFIVGANAVTKVVPDEEGVRFVERFNSVYLLDGADGPFQRYDKVALTPFGERLPWFDRVPGIRAAMLAVGAPGMLFDLGAGDRLDPLGPVGEGDAFLATPVCFESTVERVCRIMVWGPKGAARRAAVLVNVSNDAWFGSSRMARRHFVDICRLRSIETRTELVRAANTGYSVHIDSAGKVIGAAGSGRYGTALEGGWLVAQTRIDQRRPFFVGPGRYFSPIILSIAAVMLLLRLGAFAGTVLRGNVSGS